MDPYQLRFARVLQHIEANSEELLSIDACRATQRSRAIISSPVSGVARHEHVQYVQHIRMRRASRRLTYRLRLSVADIALATGYERPEALARAIRQFAGQSPSEFRGNPTGASGTRGSVHSTTETDHHEYASRCAPMRVIQFPAARVAAAENRGNPTRLSESIRACIEWGKLTNCHRG
jgi:AraC family transcriptional regulator